MSAMVNVPIVARVARDHALTRRLAWVLTGIVLLGAIGAVAQVYSAGDSRASVERVRSRRAPAEVTSAGARCLTRAPNGRPVAREPRLATELPPPRKRPSLSGSSAPAGCRWTGGSRYRSTPLASASST
jgi:hypothetical protein